MSTAVFFSTPAHGHINPTLPLVTELVAQGERVIYYATVKFKTKIERTGAIYRAYPHGEYDDLLGGNPIRSLVKLMETSEYVTPRLIEALEAEDIDYILYDSVASWGRYVATALQLPSVNSTTMFVLNQATVRELGTPLAFAKLLLNAGLSSIHEFVQRARHLNKLYNKNGTHFSDMFVNQADLNIVYTSQEFQPHGDLFDDSYCFVGSSLPAASSPSDFPMERVDEWVKNGRLLIYISLGTLFNDRIDFYRTCIEAFRDSDYRIVMSIGTQIDMTALDAPDNFIITNYAPQIDILKHANLFITHGGMNSVSEGLFYNTPLLVYPQMIEQGFVAKRVADVGAGRRLKDNELNASAIRTHTDKLLRDDSYQQAAKKIGDSLREAGGSKRAVSRILTEITAR